MPKKLEDCVKKLIKKGKKKSGAYAICKSSLKKRKVKNNGKN